MTVDGSGTTVCTGVDIVQVTAGVTCRYVGSLSMQYDAADWGGNGDGSMSGSLTRASGGYLCTTTGSIAGTCSIAGPNGVIDL